jgi:hypothetical protein
MEIYMLKKRGVAVLAMAIQFTSFTAMAQVEIVVVEDEVVPGVESHFYLSFGDPVLDDFGTVYFQANWGATLQGGGLLKSEDGVESLLLREGTPVAGLPFTGGRFNDVVVSPDGLGAGVALVAGIISGAGGESIIMIQDQNVFPIHIDGDPSPIGVGTAAIRGNTDLAIGRNGDVGYTVALSGTPGGSDDNRALIRYELGLGVYWEIVREGELMPEGDDVFRGSCEGSLAYFCPPILNEFGEAAFRAVGGAFADDEGVVRTSVRIGELFGDGSFRHIGPPRINSSGSIAYSANYEGNISIDNVFIETGGVLNAAPLGEGAPATSGGVFGSFRAPITSFIHFNDLGQVSFGANTSEPDPQGGTRNGEGLFVFDGASVISIAREYEPAPGGGTYRVLHNGGSWNMNNSGQVFFWARVDTDAVSNLESLFLYTPGFGTERLLAIGDVVEGREVTGLYDMDPGVASAGALNARGEVTVGVQLDSADDAIVLIGRVEECPADLTGDGSLNFFDVSAFLTAFAANNPVADFTGDGAFNFFDVSAFLTAFAAGCP